MSTGFSLTTEDNNPIAAMEYLIAARDYIRGLTPPEGYFQIAHSGDTIPVGGDKFQPAMLDASYDHFGKKRLSLSYPIFTPEDKCFEIFQNPKSGEPAARYLPGFWNLGLQGALLQVLRSQGIRLEESSAKCGYYQPNFTKYVEVIVHPDDFDKGRAIIQKLVHGTPETDYELRGIVQPAQQKPIKLWETVANALISRFHFFTSRPKAPQKTSKATRDL